ncbi:MAG: flagellar export chaperone FliS, partial [Bdellovibrionota bacterium]
MSHQLNKYKKTSVLSASREQILLMLYEGAIKFTKLAIQAAEQKKIADRGHNILRAFDIIVELNATLD